MSTRIGTTLLYLLLIVVGFVGFSVVGEDPTIKEVATTALFIVGTFLIVSASILERCKNKEKTAFWFIILTFITIVGMIIYWLSTDQIHLLT